MLIRILIRILLTRTFKQHQDHQNPFTAGVIRAVPSRLVREAFVALSSPEHTSSICVSVVCLGNQCPQNERLMRSSSALL